MSSTRERSSGAFSAVSEECDECEAETPHAVRVEVRTENPDADVPAASREPYRVTECETCGHETTTRMNGGGSA